MTAWAFWLRPQSAPSPTGRPAAFVSPYLNTRPGVAYVGDRVCARCHDKETEAYHRHPMGRSLESVATAQPREGLDRRPVQSFEALGSRFEIERRGQRVFHREMFRAGGVEVERLEAEVAYVMGSGSQGRSYLVERGGFLFQSPISWYAPDSSRGAVPDWFFPRPVWDLSPTYHENMKHFNRPITPACLFCHGHRPAPVEYTVNHYRTPALAGQSSIGCERCHGPGQLHVESRRRGETPSGDLTIVNPARLEPALREAVCQQCHLQGEVRVERRGRKLKDYRPGLPLHEFVSVYTQPVQAGDDQKSVSHVQQMEMSICFQKSAGAHQLGCISCHDPHAPIEPARRAAHYRNRCLNCHQEGVGRESSTRGQSRPCSLPLAERRARQDRCTSCHMPKNSSANIVHAAVTDHRILKDPMNSPVGEEGKSSSGLGLEHFHHALAADGDEDLERDYGLALAARARAMQDEALGRQTTEEALLYLAQAVRRHGDDIDALEAKGYCLKVQDRLAEALQTFEAVLKVQPERETTLFDAAEVAMRLGQTQKAVRYAERLLTVNPHFPHYHLLLGDLRGQQGQWTGAIAECRAALRLDPGFMPAREILIRCLVKAGHKNEARKEFRLVRVLHTLRAAALQEWFDRLLGE
jgi:Flp pilus assembly protein TadD